MSNETTKQTAQTRKIGPNGEGRYMYAIRWTESGGYEYDTYRTLDRKEIGHRLRTLRQKQPRRGYEIVRRSMTWRPCR